MIKINLRYSQQEKALRRELDKAIASFKESHYDKSFSQRNPHLGKMIKCQVCLTRHRSSQVCQQVILRRAK